MSQDEYKTIRHFSTFVPELSLIYPRDPAFV